MSTPAPTPTPTPTPFDRRTIIQSHHFPFHTQICQVRDLECDPQVLVHWMTENLEFRKTRYLRKLSDFYVLMAVQNKGDSVHVNEPSWKDVLSPQHYAILKEHQFVIIAYLLLEEKTPTTPPSVSFIDIIDTHERGCHLAKYMVQQFERSYSNCETTLLPYQIIPSAVGYWAKFFQMEAINDIDTILRKHNLTKDDVKWESLVERFTDDIKKMHSLDDDDDNSWDLNNDDGGGDNDDDDDDNVSNISEQACIDESEIPISKPNKKRLKPDDGDGDDQPIPKQEEIQLRVKRPKIANASLLVPRQFTSYQDLTSLPNRPRTLEEFDHFLRSVCARTSCNPPRYFIKHKQAILKGNVIKYDNPKWCLDPNPFDPSSWNETYSIPDAFFPVNQCKKVRGSYQPLHKEPGVQYQYESKSQLFIFFRRWVSIAERFKYLLDSTEDEQIKTYNINEIDNLSFSSLLEKSSQPQ